ncbi:MAG: amino acid ABC transporter ATP-binding protein [Micrococcales bacterium]
MTIAVSVRGLSKSFGSNSVLENFNLDVPAGSVTAIIGPSGSGKSTFLRTLNALELADSGTIRIGETEVELNGKNRPADLERLRSRTAMVFQNYNLFANLTALENVALGLIRVQKLSKAQAHERARDVLQTVGLSGKESAYPFELSGGQQQRVGIARALALDPEVLLFDEPTSALDPELVGEVLDVIRQLAANGRTMVLVTHEIAFAHRVANEVVFIDQGRIVEQGPPKRILEDPTEPRTREFLSRYLDFEI